MDKTYVKLSHAQAPERLPGGLRCALLVVGLILAGLLVTAACLSPSPLGYGTHRKLGFPPCTFQYLWKVPCPACGMTTSWSHFVRGQPVAALSANCGGALLAVLAVVACPWLILSGVRGRWFAAKPDLTVALVLTLSVFTITVLDWAVRLYRLWS